MSELRLKKRGKTWEYSFEIAKIDGKRKSISKCGFRTKADAATAGALAKAEYDRTGAHFVPSEISFSDFLNIWLNDYCAVNLKASTVTSYVKKINVHIRPKLGMYRLKTINTTVLQEFINNMAKSSYSRNTLSVIKGILSKCFRFAVQQQYIRHSPMTDVFLSSPRSEFIKSRQEPHVYIPPEKIEMIFSRFPEGSPDYIPMMFGYKGGMRIGEAFAVSWADVDFDNNRVSINRQIQWDQKQKVWYFSNPKYDSFRTIDIDKEFMDVLYRERMKQERAQIYFEKRFVKLYEDENRVLNTEGRGKEIQLVNIRENGTLITPRTMLHVSSIIHHKMGYPEFDFHSFRHTHATILAEHDVPMKYLQVRLGHKNLQVTMKYYLHLTDNMKDKGSTIINQIYSK